MWTRRRLSWTASNGEDRALNNAIEGVCVPGTAACHSSQKIFTFPMLQAVGAPLPMCENEASCKEPTLEPPHPKLCQPSRSQVVTRSYTISQGCQGRRSWSRRVNGQVREILSLKEKMEKSRVVLSCFHDLVALGVSITPGLMMYE
jgi:hypothetical protein